MSSSSTEGREPRAGFLAAELARFRQPAQLRQALFAGIGAFLAIAALAEIGNLLRLMLLIAPFGASAVLLFAAPASPFARPRNVIGGHVISSLVGVTVLALLGSSPLSMGLAVALAIALMMLTDTVHPPAGADALVAMMIAANWNFVLMPVLPGAIAMVAIAVAYHKYVSRLPYPHRLPVPVNPSLRQ